MSGSAKAWFTTAMPSSDVCSSFSRMCAATRSPFVPEACLLDPPFPPFPALELAAACACTASSLCWSSGLPSAEAVLTQYCVPPRENATRGLLKLTNSSFLIQISSF